MYVVSPQVRKCLTCVLVLGVQLTALQLTVEGLEKERDFYFGKLRDIEVKCQEDDPGANVVQKVLEILYATEVGAAFWPHKTLSKMMELTNWI